SLPKKNPKKNQKKKTRERTQAQKLLSSFPWGAFELISSLKSLD
ncbi:unnamed protein product, partial [Arabidopsis halleri]